LRVFLRKGGIPRTSIAWDFNFLRNITDWDEHEFYSRRKSPGKIPRFSACGAFAVFEG